MTPGKRSADQRERRSNRPLREVLDELLEHTRMLSRRAAEMSPAEREYAQQRLEWLTDEIWRVVTDQTSQP